MLREPTFLILAAIAPQPLHGYAILAAVGDLSGGELKLRAGTLYAALDRMVGDGWLRTAGEEVVDGRKRRYYQITPVGIDVLNNEALKLETNAATARQQLARRSDAAQLEGGLA